jgi:hypothetical protein
LVRQNGKKPDRFYLSGFQRLGMLLNQSGFERIARDTRIPVGIVGV